MFKTTPMSINNIKSTVFLTCFFGSKLCAAEMIVWNFIKICLSVDSTHNPVKTMGSGTNHDKLLIYNQVWWNFMVQNYGYKYIIVNIHNLLYYSLHQEA